MHHSIVLSSFNRSLQMTVICSVTLSFLSIPASSADADAALLPTVNVRKIPSALSREKRSVILQQIDALTNKLANDRLNEQLLLQCAEAYASIGEWRKALPDYNAAIGLNANNDDAYMARAHAFAMLRNRKNELADLERAIKVRPSSIAYLNKCSCSFDLRRYAEALAACSASIEMEPTYAAFQKRAQIYEKLRKPNLAVADRQAADRLPPMGTIGPH